MTPSILPFSCQPLSTSLGSDEPGPEPVSGTAADAPGEEVLLGLADRADDHLERGLAHAEALRPQGSVDAGESTSLKRVRCWGRDRAVPSLLRPAAPTGSKTAGLYARRLG